MATNIKIIDVYAAHGDGGEHSMGPAIGYFTHLHKAASAAAGKGWYGGDGGTSKHTAIDIDGTVYLLAQSRPIDIDGKQAKRDAELRQQTLASLSREQLRVLGLENA